MSSSGFKHGPVKHDHNNYDLNDIREIQKSETENKAIFCSTISEDIWNTTLKYTNSIRSRKDLLLLTSINKSISSNFEMRKFDYAQGIL